MTVFESIKNEKARHCIGMDHRKTYKRHGRVFYRPYRNYYAVMTRDSDWEELVDLGYAEREITPYENVIYHMTRKGLDWLGKMLSVTIHDEEN